MIFLKRGFKESLCSLIFLVSIGFSQEKTYTFTEEEMRAIDEDLRMLEHKDSVNLKMIANLESQVLDYKKAAKNDSLIIEYQKLQLELKDDFIEAVRPEWYESKQLYWAYGAGTILISSWIVGNVK